MKKSLTAALVAAFVVTTAGTAMASSFPEFKFDGDLRTHYRWETQTGKEDTKGGKVWFRLNAKSEIFDNVELYTRLTTQKLTGDFIGADFDKGYYGNHATSIDRFGLNIKGKDMTATVGRQGVTLGGLGLLYSTDTYMGVNMGAINGVSIAGKSGVTNLKVVAGQQWVSDSATDDKLYAIDASYSPAKDWNLGATYMRINSTTDTNYWGVNAAYTTGKATWLGEYGKSNSNGNDKAYAFGVAYTFDSKNSAYTFYNRAESSFGWTDFDANMKGMYYGFDHKFNKDYSIGFFYKSMKFINAGTDNAAGDTKTSLRTTVTLKF